jgi:2-polyprenyl-3-methyl-5-hydroxy-6-metoxy-1,4-benzoquinol methylase
MVTQVGNKVQNFYNKSPFPDYELEKFNSKKDLEITAYPFARVLDKSIPKEASIIDIGTGTGQLSAFLSLGRKCVWGIDLSDSSLKKAEKLKEKLNLDSLHLKKVDILDINQIKNIGIKFDYVLCLGVLHHTGDAYKGFENILELLKPDGFIAIGLYNKSGRIPLKTRKLLTKTIFKNNQKVKDYFIKLQIGDLKDEERARGWWNDQYLHPHETTHTIGEVLRWFKKNNIEYYETIPSSVPYTQSDVEICGVWNKNKSPNFLIRLYKQLKWIHQTSKEGGYWITLGRKKG